MIRYNANNINYLIFLVTAPKEREGHDIRVYVIDIVEGYTIQYKVIDIFDSHPT
jgi:hypothetical protein